MGLAEQRAALRALDFESIVGDALQAQKAEIVEYQKAQMLHGQNANGAGIGRYKNKDYARKKANVNPLAGYGNVDLRSTGEFHRNIGVRFFASSYVLFSSDYKAEALVEKYGPEVFGLNAEFIKDFAVVYLNDEIGRQIKKAINGL